jgi:hypothetical protein
MNLSKPYKLTYVCPVQQGCIVVFSSNILYICKKFCVMNKTIKSYNLYNYLTIPQISSLPKEMIKDIEIVGRVLPFKTNNYVTDELIDWNNVETDPIFTLNFPRGEMLENKALYYSGKIIG